MNHRQIGVDLFNAVWRLIETREDDERMLHAAHASAYHWSEAPECEPKNRARGEWQISRVYTVLGRSEPALHHAQRCLAICEQNTENMEEWDLPFAYEALARAHRVAGMNEEAAGYKQKAQELGDQIRDEEDRDHLRAALGETLTSHGLLTFRRYRVRAERTPSPADSARRRRGRAGPSVPLAPAHGCVRDRVRVVGQVAAVRDGRSLL